MDIAGIASVAKETLLKSGSHFPTLYIEVKNKKGKTDNLLVIVAGLEDTSHQKMKQFFMIGRKVGVEHPGRELAQVCFVVEAWMSHNTNVSAPSEDPNRKEVLIVNTMDIGEKGVELSMQTIEMLRDGSGELVDLLVDDDPIEVQYNKILTGFLAGYVSASMSDRQLAEMMTRYSR